MKIEKFPYYMRGSSPVKPIVSEEKDKYLAIASLLDVGKFVPDLDTEANIDILPVAFNAFVANRANANGDILGTEETVACHQNFINKPINIEHDRSKIIGVILSSAFSEFGTDKPLTEDDVKGSNKPFNVVLGGVIWRIADQGLAATIEDSSDPTSMRFGSISASWELGFAEFELAKANGESKNLEDCTICRNPEVIAGLGENYKFGEAQGEEGEILFRKPVGDIVPLGIGLTGTPAADVLGVASPKTNQELNQDDDAKEEAEAEYKNGDESNDGKKDKDSKDSKDKKDKNDKDKKNGGKKKENPFKKEEGEASYFTPKQILECLNQYLVEQKMTLDEFRNSLIEAAQNKKIDNSEKNISHSNKTDVIETRSENKIMKITSLDQINQDSMKELQASAVRDYLSEQIQEASDKYEAEKKAAKESLEVAEANFEKMNTDFEAAKKEIEDLKKNLASLQEEKAAAEKAEKFNERMASLDATYELNDDIRKVLAKQLQSVESDEDYTAWQEGMAVFMKPFTKKAEDKKESDASKAVEDAIDNGEKKGVKIPNSSEASKPKNKWADALKEEDLTLA
jgi:hypothetical protein